MRSNIPSWKKLWLWVKLSLFAIINWQFHATKIFAFFPGIVTILINNSTSKTKFNHFSNLWTLIGMRGDTFISLSFLDQILSTIFKIFWRWKLTYIGLSWPPAKLIESYKKCSLVALKMSFFLVFWAHAN